MKKLSKEAEDVLEELLSHESDNEYWKNRFEGLSHRDDAILRGCFRELSDKEMISYRYADDYPYIIEILRDGYLYAKRKDDELSPFEKQLRDLLNRAETIKEPINVSFGGIDKNKYNQPAEEWMNDVKIFMERYLANHPLEDQMSRILFHRRQGAYSELVTCLKSISKDNDFISKFKGGALAIPSQKQEGKLQNYDVFISHASADKAQIVDDLYNSLEKLGVKIFYDKESIEWGDKWKEKILQGTQNAEFAIIVISESFFGREWTELELNKFLNRQNKNGQKIILPILHGITLEQLEEKYPAVADIQAISSDKYSCDQIAMMFAKQFIKRLKGI